MLAELPNALQEKVDPVTSACSVIEVETLLHWDKEVAGLVTAGRGLTVNITGIVIPGGQLFASGVT